MISLSARRRTIRDQVSRHPLLAFVVLAYAISWVSWLLTYRIDLGAVNGFGIIGAAGPALAAMIVSALLRPEPSGVLAGSRWWLFGIVGILALAVMAFRRLWIAAGLVAVAGRVAGPVAYPTLTALLVDVLAAAVVACFLSGVHSSRQGVRDLVHSLNLRQSRVRWYWFVMAVGLYPVVIALGNAIAAGLGLPEPASKAAGLWYWLALDALIMFLLTLFGGGGLEEPGWRGFALPLLQKHLSPLRSSLILAVIWSFWHWPLFWFGSSGGGPLGVLLFMVGVAPVAILFTAVFNRSGGSLPIVILLHTSINITPIFVPASTVASGLWMLLILGVAFWMWHRPSGTHTTD